LHLKLCFRNVAGIPELFRGNLEYENLRLLGLVNSKELLKLFFHP